MMGQAPARSRLIKWFKHDSDAHRDSKLVKVRMKYGLEGYGLYWYLIEEIVSGVDGDNITFQLEHDSEIIAFNTGIHRDRIEDMMRFMVELGLFEESQGVITCLKLARRLDQSMTSNEGMRKLIAGVRKNHDSVMINHDSVMQEESREDKKRKEKTTQPNKSRPKNAGDVTEYAKSIGFDLDGQYFIDHYESNGWMRGKTKIKDWKACVRTWKKNSISGNKSQNNANDESAMTETELYSKYRPIGLELGIHPGGSEQHRDYVARVKDAMKK